MKYVIMAGGTYNNFTVPKQTLKVNGERVIDRTIRLLKENNISDIVITSNNPIFDSCGVPRISNENNTFSQDKSWTNMQGCWLDAFYKFNEPTCYLYGDVYYSENAIKTIVNKKVNDFILFGSDPDKQQYGCKVKKWEEPLAFKVQDYKTFYKAIEDVKNLWKQHKTRRHPITWEVYRYLCGYDVNEKKLDKNFVCINDISNDVDKEEDAKMIEHILKTRGPNLNMRICWGIISWLPEEEKARKLREERLNRLFNQVTSLFSHKVEFLVIAQNWKDYKLPSCVKNCKVVRENKLGILKARKRLREEFLKEDYDYIIMLDDDVIIQIDNADAPKNYIKCINAHPDSFGFLQYKSAQLNMCAISRYIYEKEPIVDIDPQKDEGYEDTTYSWLLHYKYAKHEFKFNNDIRCIQFNNKKEPAPSTWNKEKKYDFQDLSDLSWYHIHKFEKGDYKIDKAAAQRYIENQRHYRKIKEQALFNGWATAEDVDRLFKR